MDKPLRVLIIEDSEDDSLLLIRQLKKYGYSPVYERVDSAEGLKAALTKQDWELVISDYVLPRFSALEALKMLRESDEDIPCIIVSGRITDETAVAAMKAGARDYVMKDNLKRIGSAIERELAEAEVRRARRKSERDLSRAQLELRAMAHRVVQSQEDERRSIARELHDEIGQSLTGLKLMMSQAARSSPESCTAIIKDAQSVITDLMQQVREMSLQLRPSMLDDLGLLPTLLWHFERYSTQTGVKVKFDHSGLEGNFGPEINTAVYRIIQEALTNVARYARVNEVDVKIRADDGKLSLRVEDWGSGFDAEKLAAKASTGLSGMRERAQLLGGWVRIKADPGAGTKVEAEIPLRS